jgi:hypothetical protein
MVGLPCLVRQCAKLHVAGWRGQFIHACSGEVYDFYSVSPEHFALPCLTQPHRSTLLARLYRYSVERRWMWAAIAQLVWRLATGWTVWSSNPVRARFSSHVETCHGAKPAFYTKGTGLFPGVKRTGRDVDHPAPFSVEGNERVELQNCILPTSYKGCLWF